MEFTISAEELKKALHRAQGIVERKAQMPILSHVLLDASPKGLTVTAFDLDTGLVGIHPADVSSPGMGTVSARTLLEIASLVPDQRIGIKRLANNHLQVTSGAANYKIVGMAPEEYPKLPKEATAHLVKISAAVLLDLIRKSAFAISTDESRYTLNGVFFEARESGKVRMVATDGHRLAQVDRVVPADFKLASGVIIPRKGLLELRRILDEDATAECELGFAENSAIFRKAGLSLVIRLIDGQFPDYQRVIPKESERKVVVNRTKFADALKRISLLSADKSSAVRLELSDNQIKVSASNPDMGEASDEVDVHYKGPTLTVGFNARFFLDVIGVIEADDLSLELGDEHSPAVIHPADDPNYTAVIMPMRV